MVIRLNPTAEARVRHLLGSERYPDADAVIDDALGLLEERERPGLRKLRALVLAGRDSGDYRELTDELWAEIERSADERFERGEQPSPHVQP